MIIPLRKWIRLAKYLVIFVVFAYALYRMLGFLDHYLMSANKYKIPDGSAVKVFHSDDITEYDLSDRLKLFFWYGE